MKYFKGDIVEIITAKYKKWDDIPQSEQGFYTNQKLPAPIIGQRFRIYSIDNSTACAFINNRFSLITNIDCIRLYKRPFINHIYSLLNK